MKCPKCGEQQYCPCSSCRNTDKVTWVWITGNGPIACGYCGFTKSEDWWTTLEWAAYVEMGSVRRWKHNSERWAEPRMLTRKLANHPTHG